MKRLSLISFLAACVFGFMSCQEKENGNSSGSQEPEDKPSSEVELAKANLQHSIDIIKAGQTCYFTDSGRAMARFYNPFNAYRSAEKGSVWMYTSAIEAVNAVLHGLNDLKSQGETELYDAHYENHIKLLSQLVENLEYYAGTYTLTSYTQTKEWTVYGVNRGNGMGQAVVEGIANVYDDQQWLVRELIESYKITGDKKYLEKAEYLAEYVIDGWDTTLDKDGRENGGIVWGPGYYTKHACSNGPFISPLVWLHEIYKDSDATVEYRYIGADRKRLTKTMNKGEYYLMYARKVYDFQKSHLLNSANGVYWDMLGARGYNGDNVAVEIVDGVQYRGHNKHENPVGDPHSYNCGTMLSGAADLYRVTSAEEYLTDMKVLSSKSFRYFAKKSTKYPDLYEYLHTSEFSNWFDGVLLRGWIDISPYYPNVTVQAASFQNALDHAVSKYSKNGILPANLILGWNLSNESNNKVEAMFTFAYAAEYAVLAKYYLNK